MALPIRHESSNPVNKTLVDKIIEVEEYYKEQLAMLLDELQHWKTAFNEKKAENQSLNASGIVQHDALAEAEEHVKDLSEGNAQL